MLMTEVPLDGATLCPALVCRMSSGHPGLGQRGQRITPAYTLHTVSVLGREEGIYTPSAEGVPEGEA